MRPILFLDIDDVLCINSRYGGYDVFAPDQPPDLYDHLFHPPCVEVLRWAVECFKPSVVLTTSWLRMLDREGFDSLFRRTGLDLVAEALHEHHEAPTVPGGSRLEAIEGWLSRHHRGEPFAVLDDELSGTGLRGSAIEANGRVIWCDVNVGLEQRHYPMISKALSGYRTDA